MPTVALFPDRFAHYRLHAFRAIADELHSADWRLHIFASERSSVASIPLAFSEAGLETQGSAWAIFTRTRDVAARGVVLWQTHVIGTAWRRRFPVLVLWGEAHRISSWLAVAVARLRGKTVLLWSHGLYGREGAVKLFLRRRFYAMADHLLLYGENAKLLLTRHGFDPARMTVIYNALDHDAHMALRRKLWLVPEAELKRQVAGQDAMKEHLLVFVGRLTAVKRVDVLLRALAVLVRRAAGAYRVVVVGSGPEEARLKDLANALDVEEFVTFRGAVYDEQELGELFCAADLCVSPGDVGLLAVHALTYGTPVVTHADSRYQMPESEAVRPGITGELFERNDPDALTRAVERWLMNRPSKSIVRERCAAAVDEYYTPRAVAARFTHAVLAEHERKLIASRGRVRMENV